MKPKENQRTENGVRVKGGKSRARKSRLAFVLSLIGRKWNQTFLASQ